jgi:hypothetical protein
MVRRGRGTVSHPIERDTDSTVDTTTRQPTASQGEKEAIAKSSARRNRERNKTIRA